MKKLRDIINRFQNIEKVDLRLEHRNAHSKMPVNRKKNFCTKLIFRSAYICRRVKNNFNIVVISLMV